MNRDPVQMLRDTGFEIVPYYNKLFLEIEVLNPKRGEERWLRITNLVSDLKRGLMENNGGLGMWKEAIKKAATSEVAKEAAKKIGTEGFKKVVEGVSNKLMKRGEAKVKQEELLAATIEDVENLRTHINEIYQQLIETRRQLAEAQAELAATKAEAVKPWWKKW